ncbi:MAG: hypothetical protein ACJ05G_12725 [Actinomycetota bacterium]|nr:hypothetical protein [Acidimicrobiales bacterium]
MTVITIAITSVDDVAGFVEGSNSFGKQAVMDMGCLHTQISQTIMGGEMVGMTGVSFEWNDMDAAIAGSAAVNSNAQLVQMMGDCGVKVMRRSLLEVVEERGERAGEFISCVYMGGGSSSEGIDTGWGHLKGSANGLMTTRLYAGGPAAWTGTIFTWTDSVTSLASASANAWADPQMQAIQAKTGSQPLGRIINRVLA